MPQAEAGGASAWLGGELLLTGGTAWIDGEKRFLSSTQIYTPGANRWRNGPPLPSGMAYGPFFTSARGLEVFGGVGSAGPVRESWLLTGASAAWARSGDVPADVVLGSATAVGESVYLMGGCPDAADLTRCSDVVWRRDTAGGWKQISRMPQGPLALHAAAASGANILVFGGCSMAEGKAVNHSEAWAFDTAEGEWSQLPPLPAAARGVTAVALDAGRVVLVGGYTDGGFSDVVLLYDTATRAYTKLRSLPSPVMGVAAVSDGKRLYVAGGEDKARSRSSNVFRTEISQ